MSLKGGLPYAICLLVHEKGSKISVCLGEMIKVYRVEFLKNLEGRRHGFSREVFQ